MSHLIAHIKFIVWWDISLLFCQIVYDFSGYSQGISIIWQFHILTSSQWTIQAYPNIIKNCSGKTTICPLSCDIKLWCQFGAKDTMSQNIHIKTPLFSCRIRIMHLISSRYAPPEIYAIHTARRCASKGIPLTPRKAICNFL